MPIHRSAPTTEQMTTTEIFETGIVPVDLICPFTRGLQNWVIWWHGAG